MNIVILGDRTGWHALDLRRAAEALGHRVVACPWSRLSATPDAAAQSDGVRLDEADLVLVRTMPAGSLEQIVFRMDVLGRLSAAGVRVVNSPRAVEVAVDKHLALALMKSAGLPVPPTVVCQHADDALAGFTALGGDVVLKPLFGSEGVGMTRLTDIDLAQRALTMLQRAGSVLYLQKFIDHGGSDLRLMVVGDEVLGAIRRRNDTDWRTNVARGGKAEAVEPDLRVRELALRAARACGAEVAGVDILHDRAGNPFVLEVNAVPGWRAFSTVTGIDVAGRVIAFATGQP